MARILTEGFEMGDAVGWAHVGTVVETQKRSGDFAWYSPVDNNSDALWVAPAAMTEAYTRCCFYAGGQDGGYQQMFEKTLTNLTDITVRVDTDENRIRAIRNGYTDETELGVGTSILTGLQWYVVEVYLKAHATEGRLVVKVDGVTEIDFTGNTRPTYVGSETFDEFSRFRFGSYTSTRRIHIDDIAINSTNGAVDNSWCGDGRIYRLTPTSTVSEEWTSSASGDNHLMVADFPHDSDGTYIGAETPGLTDVYDMDTITLQTDEAISRVWAEARGRITEPDGASKVILGVNALQGLSLDMTTDYNTQRLLSGEWTTNTTEGRNWIQSDLDDMTLTVESDEAE